MKMAGPSAHLAWQELGCRDGTPYPVEWRETRAVELASAFEAIRAVVGQPIVIGSAFRTPAYNAKIGGAKRSQHCQGRALDLYPPQGWDIGRFYAAVRGVALDPESTIHGLGQYPTFVHVDVRDRADGRVTVWRGSRAWAELKTAEVPPEEE